MSVTEHFDVVIVGAGVIGLAIAQQLSRAPSMASRDVLLVDQESTIGQHTSSRNSEVIHAGIYYPSGSLKASLCVRGRHLLVEHCQRHHVPYRLPGKLIVASSSEASKLEGLLRQGHANGVLDLELLDRRSISALEPAVRADLAVYSPSSAIIDSHSYMVSLLHLAEMHGVTFVPRTRIETVCRTGEGFLLESRVGGNSGGEWESYGFNASVIVNCAGLDAVSLARRIEGVAPGCIPHMHLCKGDYFAYRGNNPFKHLIYPVPEANTTGLGIHATLDMGGRLRFGPDTEYVEQVNYSVDAEKRSKFARAIRHYFPQIDAGNLYPDYAGIRPKLAGPGESAADFVLQDAAVHGVPGLIQLFGIESPGLTASLAIAEKVTGMILDSL